MQKKKENLLGKIVKRNYNNRLEGVLEHKNYSEHTKSLLLSMLYKIESAYSDYEKVKQNVESKEEYIENIITLIKNKCSNIDVINPSSPRSVELGNNIFLIDEVTKSIKCFPVERKLLYAISKIGKKDYIVDKEKYGVLAKPMSDLINIGSNLNTVEPLRDFNGYSWTTLAREIESIEHNIIFQNLRILLGYQFLKDWVENREFISDYMLLFKKNLKALYGDRNAKKIEEYVSHLAILLDMKFNEKGRQNLINSEAEIANQLKLVGDNKLFAQYISDRKRKINEKIRTIDTIINNQDLLHQEYTRRNNELPYEQKIFSVRTFAEMLVKEREAEFDKIDKLNKLLLPKNFVHYKKELESKSKYLKLLKVDDLNQEIRKQILELQLVFLKCFEVKIEHARTKIDVMQLIYEFRYYYLLTYDIENSIHEIPELTEMINEVVYELIKRAKLEGIIGEFSTRPEIELAIMKEILTTRTIVLEDIYVSIVKEKDTNNICVQVFEDNEFQSKLVLGTMDQIDKKELGVKFNKRVKVFY